MNKSEEITGDERGGKGNEINGYRGRRDIIQGRAAKQEKKKLGNFRFQ